MFPGVVVFKRIALLLFLWGLFSCSYFDKTKRENRLRINFLTSPTSLDPRQGSDLNTASLHFLLYEGLMRLNGDGSLTPAQAESVEISEDGKVYTFHIRETRWSDGSLVTAQDFEKSWKTILSPTFPAPHSYLLFPIKNGKKAKEGVLSLDRVGIHSIDEKRLQVCLEKATPYFLEITSFCTLFPIPSFLEEPTLETAYRNKSSPTNGPFKISSWKEQREIIMKKNQGYWEQAHIELEEISATLISNESTALLMYNDGQLDLIGYAYSTIPVDLISKYRDEGKINSIPIPGSSALFFNNSQFPLNNKNIRKAIAMAINRTDIVQEVTQSGEVATNLISPTIKRIRSCFKDNDPETASRLFEIGLQELGIGQSQFPIITYSYPFSSLNERIALVIQDQLRKTLSISIDLKAVDRQAMFSLLENRIFEIAFGSLIATYHDPMSILERFKYSNNPKNYPGWESSQYVALLNSSEEPSLIEKRSNILEEAEEVLVEEMPITPLYHWNSSIMTQERIADIRIGEGGVLDIARIRYKKTAKP